MAGSTADAWLKLFDALSLEERLATEGLAEVRAEQIKAITGREPRLMTKFDTRESRPARLAGTTLLPLTNGSYVLLRGDGYADVPPATGVRYWSPRDAERRLETLPWRTGPASESQALDMAVATGLLQDFLGEPDARLTIRGRLRAPRFAFRFRLEQREIPLVADGVQVEVDSGFEGERIHLVEAKLGMRTNFHVRQLYYPARMWGTLVPRKAVSAVFLSFSNRCFSLRSFAFEPAEEYHAIRLVSAADYLLDEPGRAPSLVEALEATRLEALPDAPFPQADDARRVIDVVDAVAAGVDTRSGIAARYDFNERQADYYANAAAFLGFVSRSDRAFVLTDIGRDFAGANLATRKRIFLYQMARRPVFRDLMERLCNSRTLPSMPETAELIEAATGLTGKTPLRRAATVLSWTRWAASIGETLELPLEAAAPAHDGRAR